MADQINTTPGHGSAGRHPTSETLAAGAKAVALAGQADPGMFGRMFSNLPPLMVDDAALQSLANAMKDVAVNPAPTPDAGDNEQDPGRLHLSGSIRRS